MRKRFRRYLPLILLLAAIASGIGTYSAITGTEEPLATDQQKIFSWILADLILLLALGGVVAVKLVGLWLARKRESVGSRLQLRIIKRFGMVTIIPTIVVAIFSFLYFHFGIHAWFNDRVGTALNESVIVAESYLAEHKKIITADALAMANDLNRQAPLLIKSPRAFNQVINTQAALRSLTEAIVFQREKVLAKTSLSFSLVFELESLTRDMFDKAAEGEVVILTSDNDDRVRALIKLSNFFDTYLMVGRPVDAKVLQHVELTKGSATEYQQLRQNVSNLQLNFSILFGAVALLLLLASIWFGVVVSGEMVKPVVRLVRTTEKVKAGDLSVRIEEGPENDELGTLNRAFNRMTGQLEKQRNELVEVNRQIDERRRFIEAVLSGVSAGVIALDRSKRITLINRSAASQLSIDAEKAKNEDFVKLYPNIGELIEKAEANEDHLAQGDITLAIGEKNSSFHVKIVAEEFSDEIEGYIVTFDDITDLQSAQRRAAWADVARRVAHEIKNPLTPIQLASERIKRKYQDEIKDDKENFNRYVDTISRHVNDIRNMVDEFVGFARMPAPVFKEQDLFEIIRETVFSRKVASPDVTFDVDLPKESMKVKCDRGQVTQIFTNLIKNASEAVESNHKDGDEKGLIKISYEESKKKIRIIIEDNGPGFPEDLIDSITEPYVTTREKGTGLGLAIVKKIVDDHEGTLKIENKKEDKKLLGARVTVVFPKAA